MRSYLCRLEWNWLDNRGKKGNRGGCRCFGWRHRFRSNQEIRWNEVDREDNRNREKEGVWWEEEWDGDGEGEGEGEIEEREREREGEEEGVEEGVSEEEGEEGVSEKEEDEVEEWGGSEV